MPVRHHRWRRSGRSGHGGLFETEEDFISTFGSLGRARWFFSRGISPDETPFAAALCEPAPVSLPGQRGISGISRLRKLSKEICRTFWIGAGSCRSDKRKTDCRRIRSHRRVQTNQPKPLCPGGFLEFSVTR